MGKMYTLQPDESINDHVKESMSIINHIVELSIGCMRDLANPHEGTFVDMTYNKFMRSLEHIRESIQMLDELCDELEDDKDEVRREYEEKVLEFFNRFVNSDEYNNRVSDLSKRCQELGKRCQELDEDRKHFSNLAISRNKELEEERERSNQLEKQFRAAARNIHEIENHYMKEIQELTKKSNQLEKQLRDEYERYMKLREAKEHSPAYWKAKFERMQKKYTQLDKYCRELETEIDFLRSEDEEYIDIDSVEVNNPCNFCGNCDYYAQMGKDDGDFESICTQHYIKRVDPDDASCSHFKPTYDTRVVIGKPEFPCCDHCSRDDCDNCTLCPF